MVVSLTTLVSNLPSDANNIQNKNRILVETKEVREVSMANDKLIYDSGIFNNVDNFNISLDSIRVSVNTHGHQLVKMQAQPPIIEVNELVNDADDTQSEEVEEDSESDIQCTEDEVIEECAQEEVIEETQPQITFVDQSGALLEIANPQEEYTGAIVTLTDEDRDVLGRLVMGEAGNQGYEGAALVAQCIRDTMVYDGIPTVEQVRVEYKYSGHLDLAPNQNVLDAINFIFDNGGMAVKHRIQYFYAPKLCNGTWHETQDFVIEHGGHKFFAKW